MIQSKHKVIDGVEYTVTQFPARRGFKLKLTLAKKLLPGMSRLLDTGAPISSLMDTDVSGGNVVTARQSALESVNEEEAISLIMELLSMTRRSTKEGRGGVEMTAELIDIEYAGNYLALYKVLGFVLEVNYSDFFKGIGKAAAIIAPAPVPETDPIPDSPL